MSRLDSREYHWFALRVPPQRELVVKRIMANEGFATFVPVSKDYIFTNAAARARMEKTLIAVPIMPGYCFIGMSDRTPGWERVFCFTQIFASHRNADGGLDPLAEPTHHQRKRITTGVVGMDGKPYEIPHDTVKGENGQPDRMGLRQFMLRHNSGEFNAPSYHQYMQTHRTFRAGDTVTTLDESYRFNVVEIKEGKARGFIEIFGGRREIWAALENLIPI